jgi:hypothetical protein
MSYYYMRDNHTFRTLTDDVEEGCRRVKQEYDWGMTCGTVFYKSDTIKVKEASCEVDMQIEEILAEVRRLYADVAIAAIGMGL